MEIKTISLKGKAYAPVSARVEQFHKDHADGNITTSYEFKEGYVIFRAKVSWGMPKSVTPDGIQHERAFTGHAFGKVGTEKAFEKIETVSVGRALAMAGYLAGGEIASYDEMEDFVK
jgi:hypothetical protein